MALNLIWMPASWAALLVWAAMPNNIDAAEVPLQSHARTHRDARTHAHTQVLFAWFFVLARAAMISVK